MFERVTDPEILKKLNNDNSEYEEVKNPAVLNKLNEGNISYRPTRPGGLLGGLIPPTLHAGKVALQDIWENTKNVGRAVSPFNKEFAQEPSQLAKNVASGTSQIGTGMVNAPRNLPEYLSHLGLINPETAQKITPFMPAYTPRLPDTSALVNKALGATTEEDKQVQEGLKSLFALSPFGKPLGRGALGSVKLAKTGVSKAIGLPGKIIGKSDPVAAAQEAALQLQMPGRQEAVQEAQQRLDQESERRKAMEEQHAGVEQEEGKTIAAAQKEIGSTTNPNILEYNLGEQNKKINELKGNTQELESKLADYKPLESYENEDISHLEHHENAMDKVKEAEGNVNEAEQNHENASELYNDTEREVGRHLNEGSDYPLNTSREMKKEIESIENYYKDSYRHLTNQLRDSKFQLLNPGRIGPAVENAISEAKRNFGKDPDGEFARVLKKAPGAKDTAASDFMNKQKDFRDSRYDLLQRAKSEQSAVKRDELFRAYRALKPFEDFINDALAEGLGKYRPMYENIMAGYREQVYPLRENAVASNIMEGKPMGADISAQLSGDQDGQALLRELAKRNDQVKRNILGQQYKKDPNKVYNPDERLREYTNEMPNSFHRKVDIRNNALAESENSKANIERAKANHKEAVDDEKVAKKNAEEVEKQKAAMSKENQAKIASQEKEIDKIKNAIKDNEHSIQEMEADVAKKEKHLAAIKEAKSKTEQSLSQKIKREEEFKKEKAATDQAKKELTELKREIAENKKKLRESKTGLRKAFMNAKTLIKIGGKMTGVL